MYGYIILQQMNNELNYKQAKSRILRTGRSRASPVTNEFSPRLSHSHNGDFTESIISISTNQNKLSILMVIHIRSDIISSLRDGTLLYCGSILKAIV